MNKTQSRYEYVVNTGTFGGSCYVAGYEVENLVDAPDVLPEPRVPRDPFVDVTREWIRSAVRLSKATRRLVRDTLWRRPAKAATGSAA